jgi:hypothetical protein
MAVTIVLLRNKKLLQLSVGCLVLFITINDTLLRLPYSNRFVQVILIKLHLFFYKLILFLAITIVSQLLFLVEISVNCLVYVLRLPGMKEIVCGANKMQPIVIE